MSDPIGQSPASTASGRRAVLLLHLLAVSGLAALIALACDPAFGPGAQAQGISGDLAVVLDVPGASSTPGTGATISVTDITRNVSSVSTAGASTTAIYLSASSAFDASAIPVGGRAVPPLGPGESSTGSTTFTLPAGHAGVRHIFAVADADSTVVEGNEGNNVSPAKSITIGGDLIVWIDVPGSVATAVAGSTVEVQDWTRSDNSAPVGASATAFYLVTGTAIDAGAIFLGSRDVPALGPSTTHPGTTALTLPAGAAGTFRIMARADAAGAVLEANEGNNDSPASQAFTIGPDLIAMLDVPGSSAAVAAGATVVLTDITRNRGTTPVGGSTTTFFLSDDATLDAGDVLLGSRSVPPLGARSESTGQTPLALPSGIAGAYRFIAVADADTAHAESSETNNVAVSPPIAVGPDLVVTGTTVPGRAAAGATIFVSDVTKNRGAGAASTSSTGYYFSRDAVLDAGDILIGARAIPPLPANEHHVDTTTVTIPATAAGCYFIIAAADLGGAVAEGDETNQGAPAKAIRISPGPDVVPACAPRDFDGDGRSDILWRHESGVVGIWLMNGADLASAAAAGDATAGWTIQGTGDFNADGKADILWRDAAGLVGVWLMDGTGLSTAAATEHATLDWAIRGVGDFDGDSKADILWRDAAGQVGIWLMNGTGIGQAAAIATIPLDWAIQGVEDFDGDGKADILWREAAGIVGVWLMDGLRVAQAATPDTPGLDWAIHGVGDFDGDGRADILWRHASGVVGIWFMDGTSIARAEPVESRALDWMIQGVGDFDGDGKADILWRDAAGSVEVWLMDGSRVRGAGAPSAAGVDWTIE